ncbi:hypothetical protein, partial [Rhizobium sp.]|uniref:hypothetical protein n=1 Tax=Rhizobium sp. TaxID=391 RepID=UPI0039826F3F
MAVAAARRRAEGLKGCMWQTISVTEPSFNSCQDFWKPQTSALIYQAARTPLSHTYLYQACRDYRVNQSAWAG